MGIVASRIKDTVVPPNSLGIVWLAQAGFVLKTPAGSVIYVDPYLSDCVERIAGFKRLMLTPVTADEVEADAVASTHSHPDHLDVDALPTIASKARTQFVGAEDCLAGYRDAGIADETISLLREGQTWAFRDVLVTGVYADHGRLAPHAIGLLFEASGVRVWILGDTAYRPEHWRSVFEKGVDVVVPPINGAFGNLTAVEAAKAVHQARAKVAIPCHFWMFAEHNGDPGSFVRACHAHAPEVQPVLLTQGEVFVYTK
jgi:L-ascorbate 6-phosphate lactonase